MENLLVDKKSDSFVQSGYDNWKKALEKGRGFERHEKADYHREAVLRCEIAPSSAIGDWRYMCHDINSLCCKTPRKL